MIQERFKSGYIRELDGLRGVAIIWVMLYHAGVPFFRGGFIGVDIFFVLSGFLISLLLIQEFDRSNSINFKSFYMRRILRLGPALGVMVIVFCLASFAFLGEEKANSNYIDALISLAYLSNWARAFSIHPPDFLGHTWSLSIEEQFYIIWPILLLTTLRVLRNRLYVAAVAVAVALISWMTRICLYINGASPERLYNGLDTRADELMVGCALGIVVFSDLLSEKTREILRKYLKISAPLSMVCLLVLATTANWRVPMMYHFGFFFIELLTTILILDILISPRSIVQSFLSMRWLVWTGTISYGLYLWHYPVYRTLSALGFRGLSGVVIGLIATFFIAALSRYALEKPILKLKKRFSSVRPDLSGLS